VVKNTFISKCLVSWVIIQVGFPIKRYIFEMYLFVYALLGIDLLVLIQILACFVTYAKQVEKKIVFLVLQLQAITLLR